MNLLYKSLGAIALAISVLMPTNAAAEDDSTENDFFVATPPNGSVVDKIEKGYSINISFPSVAVVMVYDTHVPMTCSNGYTDSFPVSTSDFSTNTIEIWIREDLTADGVYTFEFSDESLYGDENCNYGYYLPGFNLIYKIGDGASIEDVQNNPQRYDIYRLDGTAVVRGAAVDCFNTLTPGMYIINGKKTIVR